MKDKLVKTGHKKAYYKIRAFFIFSFSILGFVFAASAPILITQQVVEIRKAEEASSIEETLKSSEETTSEYVDPLN